MPAVIVIVAFVALLAYLASSLSSSEQKAMQAQRDSQQSKEQMDGMTKQIATLQKDNALAKSPGRTTVVLEAVAPEKKAAGKKKGAATPATAGTAWAAVTWGELPDGKTFMRVNAYGLEPKLDGDKTYHLWMQPVSGNPVDVGLLEGDQNGSGFAINTELPPVDQGKSVMLTTDAQGAKQPGDVIAKADLPKLKPSAVVPPAGNDLPQAKPGNTSSQMHQDSAKTGEQSAKGTDQAAQSTDQAAKPADQPLGK